MLTTSGCGDRFGAVVQDLGDRVSVELAVAGGPHLSCLMAEQVHVRLAKALDGRPLVDGAGGTPGPVVDGSTLLVPHQLPTGMRFQTESLAALLDPRSSGPPGSAPLRWEACYQADLPPSGPGEKAANTTANRCVFTGDQPMVTTAQSPTATAVLSVGVLAQDAIRQVANGRPLTGDGPVFEYVSDSSSPQPGQASWSPRR